MGNTKTGDNEVMRKGVVLIHCSRFIHQENINYLLSTSRNTQNCFWSDLGLAQQSKTFNVYFTRSLGRFNLNVLLVQCIMFLCKAMHYVTLIKLFSTVNHFSVSTPVHQCSSAFHQIALHPFVKTLSTDIIGSRKTTKGQRNVYLS